MGEVLGKEKWCHLQVPLDRTVAEERAIIEYCAGLPARRSKEKLRTALIVGMAFLRNGALPAMAATAAVAEPAAAAAPVSSAVKEVKPKEAPAAALKGLFQNGNSIGEKR